MTNSGARTLVSVVIPTFRRPQLLKRAVDSVRRQTYDNWELIITDGETPASETWGYISALSREDDRIIAVRNSGPHGQIGNTNNGLIRAKGEWVKILHDDDALLPTCLEDLVDITSSCTEDISCVLCGSITVVDGNVASDRFQPGWPRVELLPRKDIHKAMYLLENVGGGIPSQLMVRGEAIRKGATMESAPGIRWMVDSWYMMKLARYGDFLIYRKPLVEWHQGGHETETSNTTADEQDAEFDRFRELLWKEIDDKKNLPPVKIIQQMVMLLRVAGRVKQRRFLEGSRILLGITHPLSYWNFMLWALHHLSKGRYSRAKRVVLDSGS